jgi:hypothetical protein
VEYFRDGDELHAVVVRGGRVRLVEVGAPVQAVRAEVAALSFGLRRLIRAAVTGRHVEVARQQFVASASALDTLVVAPLRTEDAVVLVPTAPLHGVPWAALPSLSGRRLVVAPSASLWCGDRIRVDPTGSPLLVAGPGLPGADQEVAALAALHPRAVVLGSTDATAAAIAAALPEASLLHVAAHGMFRADNPLFSWLQIADGRLTANDLEQMRPLPPHVVLAACEVGQAHVRPGDELLGLASVLFPAGVRTVVASLGLAPDEETRQLMVAYHRAIASGDEPAAALAIAGEVARDSGPAGEAAAAAFCCFGWG